ncbi:zinc ribbon domain-containing protein [Granulicella cerasi]|uniref:Zinc ribbon domain-containing protein n=1 Tax=Granulicella cerasi TaxID=741063 RepID=A0ABW1Z8W6_9BACT|nr:C4-type zinc ribbon domain-containing protein [Granulicella cerasi]
MNVDVEKLVVLQAIDLEVVHFRAQPAIFAKSVSEAKQRLSVAQSAVDANAADVAKEEALRRRQESDAGDHRTKVAKLSKQLDAATSTAQVNALEHELSFAREAIAKLEDEELASMERTEALEAAQPRLQQALEAAKSILAEREALAAEGVARGERELAALGKERTEVRAGIGEDTLSSYDRLSKSRGTGLAEAVDGQCSACRMKVRPQRWAEITGREHESELFTCESCGRILFYDLRRDRPAAWPEGDRLRRAVTLGTI